MSNSADEPRGDDGVPNDADLSESEMHSVAGGDLPEKIVEIAKDIDAAWQLLKSAFK